MLVQASAPSWAVAVLASMYMGIIETRQEGIQAACIRCKFAGQSADKQGNAKLGNRNNASTPA